MIEMNETERLLKVMEEYQLNAKNFAEQVGIQPATISNLVKGRNKPSLDVLQKVLNTFRMISADWLILGTGTMYRQKSQSQQLTLFDEMPVDPDAMQETRSSQALVQPQQDNRSKKTEAALATPAIERKVQKVTIFYTDGTFEEIVK